MFKDTIDDAGIEPILKSWNLLDNHDVARLKHLLPKLGTTTSCSSHAVYATWFT